MFSAQPSGSSFVLSEDKLSVDCDQLSVKFNPETMGYHVKLDGGKECTFDFTFKPVDGYFKINDGKTFFSNDHVDGGCVTAQFMPRAEVSGTMTVGDKEYDLKGTGLYLHALQKHPLYSTLKRKV